MTYYSDGVRQQYGDENLKAFLGYLREQSGEVQFEVVQVTVDGDTAEAEVTLTGNLGTDTSTMPLVREAGGWKLDEL